MGEEKIGQGKENAVAYIEGNPQLAQDIENKIRAEVFPGQVFKDKEGNPVEPAAPKPAVAPAAPKAPEAPAAE